MDRTQHWNIAPAGNCWSSYSASYTKASKSFNIFFFIFFFFTPFMSGLWTNIILWLPRTFSGKCFGRKFALEMCVTAECWKNTAESMKWDPEMRNPFMLSKFTGRSSIVQDNIRGKRNKNIVVNTRGNGAHPAELWAGGMFYIPRLSGARLLLF